MALAYLVRTGWHVWPHAQEFGRTVSTAWSRIEAARAQAMTSSREVTRQDEQSAPLAWERPASSWRAERKQARDAREAARREDHAKVWAEWKHPVD